MDNAPAPGGQPAGGLTPRTVPAKALSVPTTVSPAFQRAMAEAALLPPDRLARSPRTEAQWRGLIAANDALSRDRLAGIQAMFPGEVTLTTIAGVTVREIVPASLDPAKAHRRLIHLHGGAYVIGGGEASAAEGLLGAHYTRTRVISVDYRMPPDHPFPAAVDDAVAVWRAVTADRPPAAVGVFGTSAGGGLTLALVLKLKALGMPLPGALAPGTPWADLAGEGDSYAVNRDVDGRLPHYEGVLEAMARLYAGAAGLSDPLVSPVYGDFAGFPPSILTTGTRDILLSDTVRVYRRMRAAGVDARLEVHEAMSHADYGYACDSPESTTVWGDIAGFFDEHLEG
jgi:acetyl esterase/lipase